MVDVNWSSSTGEKIDIHIKALLMFITVFFNTEMSPIVIKNKQTEFVEVWNGNWLILKQKITGSRTTIKMVTKELINAPTKSGRGVTFQEVHNIQKMLFFISKGEFNYNIVHTQQLSFHTL